MAAITTNDGVQLYYEDVGEGPPLILIPGWSCTHHFFQKNTAALAQSCRVIAPDMRAHGDSEKAAWGHRIARYAKDVKDLIEALRLEHVTALGWSMGAAILWSYLDLFGNEHLAGHIAVDQSPRCFHNETWRWGPSACSNADALGMVTARLARDARGVARWLASACFGETYQPTPEEVEALAREIDRCPPAVRIDVFTDHSHLDWRDLFPRVQLPVLVCVGRQSKVFPWQGSAYVGEHVAGAQTVFFEHSGHMPFYEEPEKFNQVVRGFVLSLHPKATRRAR
jgi:pimeloyl-ACP methyl ester carboxylesterase